MRCLKGLGGEGRPIRARRGARTASRGEMPPDGFKRVIAVRFGPRSNHPLKGVQPSVPHSLPGRASCPLQPSFLPDPLPVESMFRRGSSSEARGANPTSTRELQADGPPWRHPPRLPRRQRVVPQPVPSGGGPSESHLAAVSEIHRGLNHAGHQRRRSGGSTASARGRLRRPYLGRSAAPGLRPGWLGAT